MTCDGKTMSLRLSELQMRTGGRKGECKHSGLSLAYYWLAFAHEFAAREWGALHPGFITLAQVLRVREYGT